MESQATACFTIWARGTTTRGMCEKIPLLLELQGVMKACGQKYHHTLDFLSTSGCSAEVDMQFMSFFSTLLRWIMSTRALLRKDQLHPIPMVPDVITSFCTLNQH